VLQEARQDIIGGSQGDRMRVMFQSRPDILRIPAGDTVQLLETKQNLERLGVVVDHCTDLAPYLGEHDIVHLFNVTRIAETYVQCENAARQGKPVALSTIYWNMEEYMLRTEGKHAGDLLRWWREDNRLRREVLMRAAVLLPNAEAEMRLIQRDFGIEAHYRVIPNGADPEFARADPNEFLAQFGPGFGCQDFVLSVGRICPRKNQLSLIRAMRGTGIPLILIGPVNDPFYFEECKREAEEHVVFLTHMPHSKLASAYRAAKVHVLPSWYDTPGLASLEAAMAGCNIVSTDRGTAKEYFQEFAWYCDPGDFRSIREAVTSASEAGRRPELQAMVMQKYTWEIAARKTREAYREVLGIGGPRRWD